MNAQYKTLTTGTKMSLRLQRSHGRAQKEVCTADRVAIRETKAMAGASVTLDAHSALAILPPDELLTEVQAVRQQNDKAYVRWPQAHLRVLWPFLPVRTALPRLEQLNEKLAAFPVELSEVRLLNGLARAPVDRAYVGVTPSDATRRILLDLVESLLEDFPECRAADSEEPDFHVTLGQFPLREAECVVTSHCVPLPLTWHCEALAFCARANSEEPFRLVQSIPLRPFYPPARRLPSMPLLPSHAWCTVVEALPVGDAARMTRLLQRQGIAWKEDWWHKLNQEYFNVESQRLQKRPPELSFCSLAAAAAESASLRCVAAASAVSGSKEAAPIFECRVVREFEAYSSVRQEVLAMPFQTASCVRHSDSRLLVVGEISSKDSGLAIWNLASLNEKPRFCKLRGHIHSIDLWQDTLLVLGKGGSLALHDLLDPRATPTSLGRKRDGAARDAHWMTGGRLVAAFAQKVRVIDLEADGGQSCDIASTLSCPVIAPLDADHVALSGQSSCVIWDLRKSASAMEVPWSSSFSCTALAASGANGLLIGGRGADCSPVHTLDLRMPTAREAILPIPGHELRADKVFAGSSCFSAQFDGSLATWHTESHSSLGWWPSSHCLSQPTIEHRNWHGLAAAGAGRLRVAMPGVKATLQRGHAKKEVKATLSQVLLNLKPSHVWVVPNKGLPNMKSFAAFALLAVTSQASEDAERARILSEIDALRGQLQKQRTIIQQQFAQLANLEEDEERRLQTVGNVTATAWATEKAALEATDGSMAAAMDTLWLCLCGALVMFMHAGFAMLETGCCRSKNASNVLMKNLVKLG
eukprot:s977_g8.t1